MRSCYTNYVTRPLFKCRKKLENLKDGDDYSGFWDSKWQGIS